jgi:hypothetical protein
LRDGGLRVDVSWLATFASLDASLHVPERGVRVAAPIQARAPPPTGAPLFLKNCALLT